MPAGITTHILPNAEHRATSGANATSSQIVQERNATTGGIAKLQEEMKGYKIAQLEADASRKFEALASRTDPRRYRIGK